MKTDVYKAFLDEMNSMAVVTDLDSRIIYANKAFMEETGYGEEIIGARPSALKSGHHSLVYYRNLYQTIQAGLRWEGTLINRRKNGTVFTEEAAIFPLEIDGARYYCKTAINTTRQEELITESEQSQKLAQAIQQSLISEDLYEQGIVIQGKYLPLENVSGDIYNHYRLDDQTYAVFLADVVGHGVASALLSTTILAIVNDLINDDPMPDVFLKGLNNKIMALFNSGELSMTTYFTGAYLLVDMDKRQVHYANCGHPKMYRLSQGEVSDFSKVNFSIGMFQNVDYEYETMTYEKGDRLLMYTDGLIEINGDGKAGDGALRQVLKDYSSKPAKGSLVDFLEEALVHGAGNRIKDDITMIAIDLTEAE